MQRKYLAEFGLNVYTSYKSLLPIELLEDFEDKHKSHIYFILSCSKLEILQDSIVSNENGISLKLKRIVKNKEEIVEINNFKIIQELDYSKIKASTTHPYNNLKLTIMDEKYTSRYGERPFIIDTQTLYNISRFRDPFILNVEYIGQAYGRQGEITAKDRLSSHSTLQKILTDCNAKFPEKKIYILLLEMQEQIMMTVDGLAKETSTSVDEDEEHHKAVFENLPREAQVINIAEASLIHYFKPPYNTNFVENFPSLSHSSYSQYFTLDYNSLTVELDLEFDDTPRIELTTLSGSIKYPWDFIQYSLHNNPLRKSMYHIFGDTTSDK